MPQRWTTRRCSRKLQTNQFTSLLSFGWLNSAESDLLIEKCERLLGHKSFESSHLIRIVRSDPWILQVQTPNFRASPDHRLERIPLKRSDFPMLDQHCGLQIQFGRRISQPNYQTRRSIWIQRIRRTPLRCITQQAILNGVVTLRFERHYKRTKLFKPNAVKQTSASAMLRGRMPGRWVADRPIYWHMPSRNCCLPTEGKLMTSPYLTFRRLFNNRKVSSRTV